MKKKTDGVAVTNETATPLHSGMHPYWAAHWKGVVLEFLSDSHPNVEVDYDKRGDGFRAIFRKDDPSGREMCGPSRSLADPKTMVPESEIDALVDSLDRFHKEAANAANMDGARQFVREYRIPNPRQMRDAWRVGRSGRFKKLLLLWGYHPNGAANDAVLPLTPTSEKWDDVKQRVNLKEALLEMHRIGKSRLDWGWIVSRILLFLLIILLLSSIGCWVHSEVTGGGCVGISTTPTLPTTTTTTPPTTPTTTTTTPPTTPPTTTTTPPTMPPTTTTTPPTTPPPTDGPEEELEKDPDPPVDDPNEPDPPVDDPDEPNPPVDDPDEPDSPVGDPDEPDPGPDIVPVTTTTRTPPTITTTTTTRPTTSTTTTTRPPDFFCPTHNVKLVNGKCPKFCTKHPDIHLDKDGKCRICEGTEPPPPPDCSIVLQDRGEHGDGSFQPTFKLVSQNELPGNATIAWSIDGGPDQALGETFAPHFPDASPHTIKAAVEWVDDGTLRNVAATLPWNPAPTDERIVHRDIVQIQKRNVGHETIYIYALTSDAESGRATVRTWSVERRQDDKPSLKLKSDTEMNGQHLLVHGKDIAGEANLTIVAEVSLGNNETTKVEKTFHFRYDIVTKSESVSDEETTKLSTAGNGVIPSVYLVWTGNGSGTAFAVDKRKLVTNAHVVESVHLGGKVTLFQANSPKQIEGVVQFFDARRDLALISVSDVELVPIPFAENLTADQPVAFIGFPFSTLDAEKTPDGGFSPAVSIGRITGIVNSDDLDNLDGPDPYRGFMVTSDALTNPGSSGSPVVDESGRVVGVLRAGIYDIDGSTSGLIPVRIVQDFLNPHEK